MNRKNYINIKKNDPITLKYMLGNAYAKEDVLKYKFDENLKKEIGVIKKLIKVYFKTGPWSGKEFLFTKEQIKNNYGKN